MLEASQAPLTTPRDRSRADMARPKLNPEQQDAHVWALIDVKPTVFECWPWKRKTSGRDVYPYVGWRGRNSIAARAVYDSTFGLPADDVEIDHLCRNRQCCNPHHLQAVTATQNVLRGTAPMAVNARKTRCPLGHDLAGENLILSRVKGRPFRQCRTCNNESKQRMRSRQVSSRLRPTKFADIDVYGRIMKGERVEFTDELLRQMPPGHPKDGIVTRSQFLDSGLVCVRTGKSNRGYRYHASFLTRTFGCNQWAAKEQP